MISMDLLKVYKNNRIIEKIMENLFLYNRFDNVYLFGSILSNVKMNIMDIDILLIYDFFSDDILHSVDNIKVTLKDITEYDIDLTVLSTNELDELHFLEKLDNKYLKIK